MPLRLSMPGLLRSPVSIFGAIVAVVAAVSAAVLLAIHYLVPSGNPYFGIFLFLFLPIVLVGGLLLVPIGAWREWRRRKRTGATEPARWPLIDLNRPHQRSTAVLLVTAAFLFMAISAVGSYGAYHYSESVTFCGTTCHAVMKPEYTTYLQSTHARVACAECHVGAGADWYVKSKLSGSYQVYAVLTGKIPRPIPTPIENLRPAQETCEQCHWPGKFYGAQLKRFRHTMYDEKNTDWPIDLLIKTGGSQPIAGEDAGIHWHMNLGIDLEYIARDRERQDIPWIRIHDRVTGRVTVYQDDTKPLGAAEVAATTPRRMDCVECHNRPAHVYLSPEDAVDRNFRDGELDPTLPSIKKFAVEAMAMKYETTEAATEGIAERLFDDYRKSYPELWQHDRARIDKAIATVQSTFRSTIFPEMKVRWDAYPVNIGHFRTKGCMRCHDGHHKSESGAVVTLDCQACHTILAQGTGPRYAMASSRKGLDFDHPEDIGDVWREGGCWDCHNGTKP